MSHTFIAFQFKASIMIIISSLSDVGNLMSSELLSWVRSNFVYPHCRLVFYHHSMRHIVDRSCLFCTLYDWKYISSPGLNYFVYKPISMCLVILTFILFIESEHWCHNKSDLSMSFDFDVNDNWKLQTSIDNGCNFNSLPNYADIKIDSSILMPYLFLSNLSWT